MPEEAQNAQEGQEDVVEVKDSDKTKSTVIILIVMSLVVMILTPVITVFVVKAVMPKPEVVEDPVSSESTEIDLGVFKANISDSQGTRFTQIKVVIEVSRPSIQKYFMAKDATNEDGMLTRVKDAILRIISDKTLEGLLSSKAKERLAKEIKAELNSMLEKRKADGVVTAVLFPEFLVQ